MADQIEKEARPVLPLPETWGASDWRQKIVWTLVAVFVLSIIPFYCIVEFWKGHPNG